MSKFIAIMKSVFLSKKLFSYFTIAIMLLTIMAFLFESIKPTSAYIELALPIAIFCSVFTLLWSALHLIKAYKAGLLEKKEGIKGEFGEMVLVFLPFFFAFAAYNTTIYGIPIILHPISSPEPIQISVHVARKEIDTSRGAPKTWGETTRHNEKIQVFWYWTLDNFMRLTA